MGRSGGGDGDPGQLLAISDDVCERGADGYCDGIVWWSYRHSYCCRDRQLMVFIVGSSDQCHECMSICKPKQILLLTLPACPPQPENKSIKRKQLTTDSRTLHKYSRLSFFGRFYHIRIPHTRMFSPECSHPNGL